ncbi:MAG TPA: transcriptional repressor [Candidatus Obscuribacterales bacterium]
MQTKPHLNQRLTKGCKKVLEILERTDTLSSAQDIHSALRNEEQNPPGLTTVYRSLESLVGLGLVQSVDLGDGERRFELVKPGEHHHHLVCDKCRSSVHLDQCLVAELEEAIKSKYGFEVRGHILEIFGLCAHCQR